MMSITTKLFPFFNTRSVKVFVFLIGLFFFSGCGQDDIYELYVGTYTKKEGHVDGKANGIYVLSFDPKTGTLSNKETIEDIVNPSYIDVDHGHVYAVSEIGADGKGGQVCVFGKHEDRWTKDQCLDSGGAWPCHIRYEDNVLYVANYSGTISRYKDSGGELALIKTNEMAYQAQTHSRQESAHAHMVYPYRNKLFVADLGANEIKVIDDHQNGDPTTTIPASQEGAGPRHLAIKKNHLYVLNELNNSIDVFNIDKEYAHVQNISCLNRVVTRGLITGGAIKVHPKKEFLYSSSRGLQGNRTQTINLFHILPNSQLKLVNTFDTKGQVPRDFSIDPSGKYLLAANQDSDSIVVFEIDQTTGALTQVGHPFSIPTPVCLVFEK